MKEANPFRPPAHQDRKPTPSKLMFLAGFALVFVAYLFLQNQQLAWKEGLISCKLWEYYSIEARRLSGPQTLGSGQSGLGRLLQVFFWHVVVSLVGGCLAVGMSTYFWSRGSSSQE